MSKILFIDSNASFLETMGKYLSWYDFDIHCLQESTQAIIKLRDTKYDLCICDVFSNPIDGYDLVRMIKKANADTKILLVAKEEALLEEYIFMRKHQVYFMTKYRGAHKWVERIEAILR